MNKGTRLRDLKNFNLTEGEISAIGWSSDFRDVYLKIYYFWSKENSSQPGDMDLITVWLKDIQWVSILQEFPEGIDMLKPTILSCNTTPDFCDRIPEKYRQQNELQWFSLCVDINRDMESNWLESCCKEVLVDGF